MPIYEYKCQNCENYLETMQKISDEPLKECPKCGGALEKQWSRTGFQFKGTGWYVTDYAGKGAETKSETKSETGETAKTSSDNSTSGGDAASKPETKSVSADSNSST